MARDFLWFQRHIINDSACGPWFIGQWVALNFENEGNSFFGVVVQVLEYSVITIEPERPRRQTQTMSYRVFDAETTFFGPRRKPT